MNIDFVSVVGAWGYISEQNRLLPCLGLSFSDSNPFETNLSTFGQKIFCI